MRRIVILIICAILSLSLSGCAGSTYVVRNNNDQNTQVIQRPGLFEGVGSIVVGTGVAVFYVFKGVGNLLFGSVEVVDASRPTYSPQPTYTTTYAVAPAYSQYASPPINYAPPVGVWYPWNSGGYNSNGNGGGYKNTYNYYNTGGGGGYKGGGGHHK